jgi:RHS repeat-associated protein
VVSDDLFYPFGQTWTPPGTSGAFGFAGFQDSDGNVGSGLYPAEFRVFPVSFGRWLTPDPAGLVAVDLTNPQSFNRYAYVLNNPTTLVDPSGLFYCDPGSGVYDNQGNLVGYTDCTDNADSTHTLDWVGGSTTVTAGGGSGDDNGGDSGTSWNFSNPWGGSDPGRFGHFGRKAASNGTMISAVPPQLWYKNSCITGALDDAALHVGIDAIGLIPEAGGVARLIGHGAGYRGVVADQLGNRIIKGVGASANIGSGVLGLGDTSAEGLISTGLIVVGFIPGAGQIASGISLGWDIYRTAKAIGQCN